LSSGIALAGFAANPTESQRFVPLRPADAVLNPRAIPHTFLVTDPDISSQ